MNKRLIISTAAILALSVAADAATVGIDAVDIRSTGVFGHDPNISAFSYDSVTPSVTFTYSNLNLDGDASANDSLTFTLTATSGEAGARWMNQGYDTGFGNLNDTVLTGSVTGTTTDSGDLIVFDGFTGATVAAGRTGSIDSTVEVTPAGLSTIVASLVSADTGGFQFIQTANDFGSVVTSVAFGNSVNNDGGTIVARNFDLQFSTTAVPEPSSYAMLAGALALGAVMIRRRRS